MKESIQEMLNKLLGEGGVLTLSVKLVGALLILLAGWIIAAAAAKLIRAGLEKFELGRKLSRCLPEDHANAGKSVELWITRCVFYLVMLLTVLAFLQVLGLSGAAEPINQLLTTVTGYLANLAGAAALLAFAWVLATVLRYFTGIALAYLRLDEKISAQLESSEEAPVAKVSSTIADAVYWMVFLCFMPGLLGILKIDGILTPFSKMFDRIFEYLPSLAGAAGVLIVGLFVAKILRKVITKLLFSLGSDMLCEKAGLGPVFGRKGLSNAAGILGYVLVVIPTLALALDVLRIRALSDPVSKLLDKMLGATGNVFGAAIILLAAYVVGHIVSGITAQLLESFGFDKLFRTLGVTKTDFSEEKTKTPSVVTGKLIHVAIMLFAVVGACDVLNLDQVGVVVASFLPFAGRILIGVVIFIIGIYLSNLAADALKGKGRGAGFLAIAVRCAILIFVGAMALNSMGIADDIIQIAFALILGAFAVAAAVAFGIGGRELAAKKLQEWNDSLQNNKK